LTYPTIADVVKADHEQICRWWKSLESPETPQEERVMDLIFKKLQALGGLTPEISRKIG
jgi:hypothetical protein